MAQQAKRSATEAEFEAIRSRLAGLSFDEKVSLAAKTRPVVEKRGENAVANGAIKHKFPETDDELWEWIKRETGYEIPRVAVCPDHCAPFDFIADGFFERKTALFQLGSREMGKTLGVSILHYCNSVLRPRCESITFGAIEDQAKRAYNHVLSFINTEIEHPDGTIERRPKDIVDGEPKRSETKFKNGSKVEIITGTRSGVNSPHGQKVHADEVDLMDEGKIVENGVWDESRNISSSKKLPDGTRIQAQDYGTSTRKSVHGRVQQILDEAESAVKAGLEPAWATYSSCIFEAAQEVPNCRSAPPAEREARLRELGEDPCSLCDCDKIAKGEWAEDIPRTLDTVCKGKFFRSRGWMPHADVKRKFRLNTPAVWSAQMECRRPLADGLYLEGWVRERFSVVGWQPRPELGQIWTGTDWGGSAESAVLWSQGPLRVPVTVQGSMGLVIVPVGSYVVFDELLEANIGATKLGDKVVAKEIAWRRQIPGFRVSGRFADMAGKQQRDDWREHTPSLRTSWYLPDRAFDSTVECLQDLVTDKHYWIDSRCSRHIDDVESWRQKGGKEVHDASSHSPAASRYMHKNVETFTRRNEQRGNEAEVMPVVVARPQDDSLAAVVAGGGDPFADERAWRGMPTTNHGPYGR